MRLYISAGFVFFGISAIGETIPVISGEHDGFTRLVLTVDPTKPWRLQNSADRSNLIFEESHDFQSGEIFDRIPRSRLKDVTTSTSAEVSMFSMDLNCKCEVNAYSYQNAHIIVDISDPSQDVLAAEPSASPAKLETYFSPDPLPDLSLEIDTQRPDFPYFQSFTMDGYSHEEPEIADEIMPEPVHVEMVVEDVDPELQKTVDEARDALIRQLSFAADQGLLDFKPDETSVDEEIPDIDSMQHEGFPETEDAYTASSMEDLANQEQISIQSVYDTSHKDDSPTDNSGKICFQDFEFNIQNWASGENFSEELSMLRVDQIGEFDVTNIGKLDELIKLYIRYGFGAEAKYLIDSYHESISHPGILIDLAFVMSGRIDDHKSTLENAVDCEGAVGMWALASESDMSVRELVPRSSIPTYFAQLPADIRRTIGPRLIEAYLRRNMGEEARLISDLISRAHGEDSVAVEVSHADMLMEEGQIADAKNIYRDVLIADTAESLPALMALVEIYLHEGREVPEDYKSRVLLEADTHRGTQFGLIIRELDVRLTSDREVALLKLMHEIEVDSENEEIYREMGRGVLSDLSHTNPNFIKILTSNLDFLGSPQENIDLRFKLASEALANGFPNAASMLLSELDAAELDHIYLLGRIEAASYNLDEAELAFLDVDSDMAKQQIVRLNLASGKFEEALKVVASIEDAEFKSVDPDWFPGSWREAAGENPAALTIFRLYLSNGQAVTTVPSDINPNSEEIAIDTLEYFRSTLNRTAGLQDEISELGFSEN